MQTEIIALAACYRELILVVVMVKEVGTTVGVCTFEGTKMHMCIHNDNAGVFILSQTLPPQFTPVNKQYAVKTHWSGEQYISLGVVIQKISTIGQFGDICTKCLPTAHFQYLSK